MNEMAVVADRIPPMSTEAVEQVRKLETAMLSEPQTEIETRHLIHGGVYMRTITMPANTLLAGAFVKIPTTLIVSGCVTIYMDGDAVDFVGYNVLPASGGRKQAVLAHTVADLTMLFPTSATTVAEAEAEFTDELELLVSRKDEDNNVTFITGE